MWWKWEQRFGVRDALPGDEWIESYESRPP